MNIYHKTGFLIASFLVFLSFAHANGRDTATTSISPTHDETPIPPGGEAGYYKYLAEHIHMPEEAIDAGVQGTVYISIVVGKDGTLSDVKVKKDPVGHGCAEEAIRVIKDMPKWTPGKMNGMPVSVRYSIPVKFVLHSDKTDDGIHIPDSVWVQVGIFAILMLGGLFLALRKRVPNSIAIEYDEAPSFPGGQAAYEAYVAANMQYPEGASKANAQGTVLVSMQVEKDGTLSNIIIKKDNVGHGAGKEALRILKAMPRWKPATKNGVPVAARWFIIVTFVLK